MNRKFSAKDKQEWAEKKREEQKQMLVDAVSQLASKTAWQNWVRFGRNNLKKYSFNNAVLIYWQKPDATLTKGREAWKKEKVMLTDTALPIKILAPVLVDVRDENGNTVFENGKAKKRVGFYRTVVVYDVSDTDAGEIKPPQYKTLDGDDFVNLSPRLEGFAKELGWKVVYDDNPSEKEDSWLLPDEKFVIVNATLPVNQIVYTLVKQLAAIYGDTFDGYDKKDAEAITESAAIMSLGMLGFDVRKEKVPFVAQWGTDVEVLKKYTYTVDDLVKTLSERMAV